MLGASLKLNMEAAQGILVIADNPTSVAALTGILTSAGYDVRQASGTKEALGAIAAEVPHLVLMEIGNKRPAEHELRRKLNEDVRARGIPVIYVEETAKEIAHGAVDVIKKPFRPDELLALIRMHIDFSRLRMELEAQVAERTNGLRAALQRLEGEIAERKCVELALRRSEELNRLAMQAGRTYAFEWNPATDEVRRSHNCADILGISGDATRDTWTRCIKRVHPDDREAFCSRIAGLRPGADSCECDYRLVGGDGQTVYLHAVFRAVFDSKGNVSRYVGFVADATRTRQAEAALNESEERFRNMADAAPIMICASGPDKCATYFNKAWLAFTGRSLSEELGDGWTAGVHPDDLDRCLAGYSASFERRGNCHLEYRLRRSDGEYRWIVCSGVPRFITGGEFRGYIASAIDITYIKRSQEETFDRQKMESLRVLTGGIAHDFNNLLGSILVETELAETELAEHTSPLDAVHRIRGIARRAAEIVRQLMIYSGQDKATLETLDISLIVEEMLELLKVSISKYAVLKTELPKELPPVLGNAGQIRQVVMNLILNASEAMDGRGGCIRVRTSKVETYADRHFEAAGSQGEYVRLEIADTGLGIPEEVRSRIFEPFFTTKPRGHGLGLSVVQGIVHSHGGSIQVRSAPSSGTTFEVLLPCASLPAAGRIRSGHATFGSNRSCRTVLLVEDEESLRIAVGKALRRRGFSLLAAGDGSTAVDIFRERPQDIGAVILDLTLPGLPGAEALRQIHIIEPEVPVILASGYDRDGEGRNRIDRPHVRFLRKPYQIDDLVECLRASAPSTVPDSEAGAACE